MQVNRATIFALLLVACDFGSATRENDQGPPVFVKATAPASAAQVPADGTITIAFDRLLDPQAIGADTIVVLDAGGARIDATRAYDPVRRVVRLYAPAGEGRAWLPAGQNVRVQLGAIESIDRAPLAATTTRELTFAVVAPTGTETPPEISFCRDVLPVFVAKCAGGACHGAIASSSSSSSSGESSPVQTPVGLILDTPLGIANTAVARVAQGSNTGLHAGVARGRGAAFGIDMPIIDPRRPGSSWILYKSLLSPVPAAQPAPIARPARCDGSAPSPATVSPGIGLPLEDAERARLAGFVPGQPMPYPTFDKAGQPTFDPIAQDDLDRIRLWIEQGAVVRACTSCER